MYNPTTQTKSSLLTPWRLIGIASLLLLLALAFLIVLPALAATPPEPTYASANVDGNPSEWNLAEDGSGDFFANMYNSGDPLKPLLSKAYVRYQCSTETLFVLVLADEAPPDYVVIESDNINASVSSTDRFDTFVKINTAARVNGFNDNAIPQPDPDAVIGGDLAYIGQITGTPFNVLDPDPTWATGWEASFSLAEGDYPLGFHPHTNIRVPSEGEENTSEPDGGAIDLLLDCSNFPTDEFDYGDAPDASVGTATGNYETTAADSGPNHAIVSGLNLGAVSPDGDDGTLQNTAASADDNNGGDDEDGVTILPSITTASTSVPLSVDVFNNTGLNATVACWIDFNLDGDFTDSGERASAVVSSNVSQQNIALTFSGFAAPTAGTSYIRCRIANNPAEVALPTGAAQSGEVEDFLLIMDKVAIGNIVWADNGAIGPNNGQKDTDEGGIDGVIVELYLDVDGDSVCEPGGDDGAALATATTAGGGIYQFLDLTPSTTGVLNTFYCVAISRADPVLAAFGFLSSSTGGAHNPNIGDHIIPNGDDGVPSGSYVITQLLVATLSGQGTSQSGEPSGYGVGSTYMTVDFGFLTDATAVNLKTFGATNGSLLLGLLAVAGLMLAGTAAFVWQKRQ